jgi:hypothetical protein
MLTNTNHTVCSLYLPCADLGFGKSGLLIITHTYLSSLKGVLGIDLELWGHKRKSRPSRSIAVNLPPNSDKTDICPGLELLGLFEPLQHQVQGQRGSCLSSSLPPT